MRLTRLILHTRDVLDLRDRPTHLWSDSAVTLGWIRGHPSHWKTYVANRVSEIQTTLTNGEWHHVASCNNLADCGSRGMSPGELIAHELWWAGPSWLSTDTGFQEATRGTLEEEHLPEERVKSHAGTVQPQGEEPELLNRFSSLQRLLRITAWCLRDGFERRRTISRMPQPHSCFPRTSWSEDSWHGSEWSNRKNSESS